MKQCKPNSRNSSSLIKGNTSIPRTRTQQNTPNHVPKKKKKRKMACATSITTGRASRRYDTSVRSMATVPLPHGLFRHSIDNIAIVEILSLYAVRGSQRGQPTPQKQRRQETAFSTPDRRQFSLTDGKLLGFSVGRSVLHP